jgi:hypothetical protein
MVGAAMASGRWTPEVAAYAVRLGSGTAVMNEMRLRGKRGREICHDKKNGNESITGHICGLSQKKRHICGCVSFENDKIANLI